VADAAQSSPTFTITPRRFFDVRDLANLDYNVGHLLVVGLAM
jgi:hypothetical protein